MIQARADRVDAKAKKIHLSDGQQIAYDKLLLGSGARPIIPPIEGRELRGVFALWTLSDAEEIRTHLEVVKPRKLVFDRKTGRLLEGQILSEDIAPVKEIDTVNALILSEKTLYDLTVLMCAGTPDCSPEPSLEPISIAAEQALQKLRG